MPVAVRTISYATRIHFGPGALGLLPRALDEAGVRKPLLVCDVGVREAGLVDRVAAALGRKPQALETLELQGGDEDALRWEAARARQRNCDGLLAVGGGSVIDAAKVLGLCMVSAEPLASHAVSHGGTVRLPALPPLVCVPTTAGTGSDVSRGAAVASREGRLVLLDRALFPHTSICDPELTLGLPAGLTAATAVDALTHCIEAFLSPAGGPPFDAVAAAGIRRIFDALPRCLDEPGAIQHRADLMLGALEGGISMPLGLGAMHGLGVPLDGPGVHHGTVVGVLAPHVIGFYERNGAPRVDQLRQLLGLRARQGAVSQALVALLRRCGLPTRLAQAGVAPAQAPAAAAFAAASPYHAASPVRPTDAEYAQLIEEAM